MGGMRMMTQTQNPIIDRLETQNRIVDGDHVSSSLDRRDCFSLGAWGEYVPQWSLGTYVVWLICPPSHDVW